jgi:hypothetical protein
MRVEAMRVFVVAGLLAGAAVSLRGQMHKVEKPETVVRAVGVYEWTGDLAKPKGERLVPVTIYIDGQVQDGAVYLSRPVPMTLQSGNLYELDEAGVEKGLVDVKEARHVQIPAAADLAPYDDGWFGYGLFEPPPAPKPVKVKLTNQRVAVNGKVDDPDRPSFSKRSAQPGSGDGVKPAPGSPEDVKIDSGTDDKDDVDRPTLRRRTPVDPAQAKKDRKKQGQASVTGDAEALNDDPDRPRMRRSHGEEDTELPVLNGLPPDMHQMAAVSDPKNREPHVFVRPWEDDAERKAVLEKMRAFARAQLVAYGPVPKDALVAGATAAGTAVNRSATVSGGSTTAGPAMTQQDTSSGAPPVLRRNTVAPTEAAKEQVTAGPVAAAPVASAGAKPATAAKAATPAKPLTPAQKVAARRAARLAKAAAAKAAALPPAPEPLLDEDLKGFLLSYGGDPTYVYTAHTGGNGVALRYVTIVAQQEGVNGLHMAMHNVTDAAHLDRQPWMRFVDVVDVEASNRASL